MPAYAFFCIYAHTGSMQCPSCNECRYSRDWKPSQWKAETANIHYFNCCRQCSPDGYVPCSSGEQRAALEWCRDLYREFEKSIPDHAKLNLNLFFESWMASGHQNRKYWSYFGALKRGEAEAPRAQEIVQWMVWYPAEAGRACYCKRQVCRLAGIPRLPGFRNSRP